MVATFSQSQYNQGIISHDDDKTLLQFGELNIYINLLHGMWVTALF